MHYCCGGECTGGLSASYAFEIIYFPIVYRASNTFVDGSEDIMTSAWSNRHTNNLTRSDSSCCQRNVFMGAPPNSGHLLVIYNTMRVKH